MVSVSNRHVLDEIEKIITHEAAYGSRKQGKNFYEPLKLPSLLQSYIKNSNLSIPAAATIFGMSRQTLKNILDGGALSENMLFRIRNALESSGSIPPVYPGNWRSTNSAKVQNVISEDSERLIFLKKVIESSNIVKSDDSPIDRIQIAQLIPLLEATLAAIKAPQIETKQTGSFFKWLRKLGEKAVEKGLESEVSQAIEGVIDAGKELLKNLSNASESSDLGNMIT